MNAVHVMRKTVLGLLLLGAVAQPAARAAEPTPPPTPTPTLDPAHLAAAARLMADTGGKNRMDEMMTAMRGIMVQLVSSRGKDAAESGRIVDEVLLPAMRAHLPELQNAFTRFWAGAMTTAELDSADAFFRSPTGMKLVAVQTQAVPAFLALGQAWGQQVAKDVLSAQRDALRQRGVTL